MDVVVCVCVLADMGVSYFSHSLQVIGGGQHQTGMDHRDGLFWCPCGYDWNCCCKFHWRGVRQSAMSIKSIFWAVGGFCGCHLDL